VVFSGSGGGAREIAAFAFTGTHPGISASGEFVAFLGDRGFGEGIFLSENRAGGRTWAVAGERDIPLPLQHYASRQSLIPARLGSAAALEEGFTDFDDGQRVGVAGSGDVATVMFAAARGNEHGVSSVDVTLRDGELQSVSTPKRIVFEGLALGGSTVTGFALHDPLNRHGRVAVWVTFADGTQGVLRGEPAPMLVIAPDDLIGECDADDPGNNECNHYFSIPPAGEANAYERELYVKFLGDGQVTGYRVEALIDDRPFLMSEDRTSPPPLGSAQGSSPPVYKVPVADPASGEGVSATPWSRVSYRVTLFLDGGAVVTGMSGDFGALWKMEKLLNGEVSRFSCDDRGGDDWAAAGTIEWIRDLRPKILGTEVAGARLLFAINDISGEHGLRLGHTTHTRGTEIDMFHFREVASSSPSAGNGDANYRGLETLTIDAITKSDESARQEVARFFEATRRGLEILVAESEPGDAVGKVLLMPGRPICLNTAGKPFCCERPGEPTDCEGNQVAGGPLLKWGWAFEALRDGRITTLPPTVTELLNLGIASWQSPVANLVRPVNGHNSHLHVDLNTAAIGAFVPTGCSTRIMNLQPAVPKIATASRPCGSTGCN